MSKKSHKGQLKVFQYVFTGIHDTSPAFVPSTLRHQQRLLSRKERQRAERREFMKEQDRKRIQAAQGPRRLQDSSSQMALLPPPKNMNAPALARAANIAAREATGVGPAFWASLSTRTWDLLPILDTQDLAQLLNGMARAQHLDSELFDALRQQALEKVAYFNARHLAMALSALTIARMPRKDLEAFLPELQDRVPEFQRAGELTMAIAALGRLRKMERGLVESFASQVELRLSAGQFQVRDLANISAAYVRLDYDDSDHFAKLFDHAIAIEGLKNATPTEVARLVLAASSAPSDIARDFVGLVAPMASAMISFMTREEITSTVFAFGSSLKLGLGESEEAIKALLVDITRHAALISDRFETWQLASLLHSCARWHLPLALPDAHRILKAFGAKREEITPAQAKEAVYALARLEMKMDTGHNHADYFLESSSFSQDIVAILDESQALELREELQSLIGDRSEVVDPVLSALNFHLGSKMDPSPKSRPL